MKEFNRTLINTLAGSAFAAVLVTSGFASAGSLGSSTVDTDYSVTITLNNEVEDARGSVLPDVWVFGGDTFDPSAGSGGGDGDGMHCYEDSEGHWICPIKAAMHTSSGMQILVLNLQIQKDAPVCGGIFDGNAQAYSKELGDIQISYKYSLIGQAYSEPVTTTTNGR